LIDNPIFSIIVPVYNVEPYLEKCLKSILNQTLQNIEVILVYDPSTTDESLIICKRFLEKSTKFSLHFSKNNGAGAVRNYGFDQAIGIYICYVDGDDCIDPQLCSDMLVVLDKSGTDFVNFGFDFVNDKGKVLVNKGKYSQETLHGEDIFRKAMLDDEIFTVVWNKVYRRSFLIENQIRFPEVKVWEDVLYSRIVAYYSQNTCFVPKVFYHALIRNGSFSRAVSSSYLLDGLSLFRFEHQFILATPNGMKFENLFKAHFIKHISFFLLKAAFQVQSWPEYLQCFESIRSSEYSIYIKESEVRELLSNKNRIMIFVCKFPKILRIFSSILQRLGISPY